MLGSTFVQKHVVNHIADHRLNINAAIVQNHCAIFHLLTL